MRHGLALALVILTTSAPTAARPLSAPTLDATVLHVDDGDTIDVRIDGRVERIRYIGIDAPEVAHDGVGAARGGEAATRLNRTLLRERRVRLELDRETRDRYGRLLAYVWAGSVMVNLEMVRRGYARVLTIPPNARYAQRFARAEAAARAAQLGLWSEGGLDAPAIAPFRRGPMPTGEMGAPLARRMRRRSTSVAFPGSFAPSSGSGSKSVGCTARRARFPITALHRGRPFHTWDRRVHNRTHLNDAATWSRQEP